MPAARDSLVSIARSALRLHGKLEAVDRLKAERDEPPSEGVAGDQYLLEQRLADLDQFVGERLNELAHTFNLPPPA